MTKRERSLVGLLVVLAVVSGLIWYFNTRDTSSAASVVSRSVISPVTTRIWSSSVGPIDRAVATTP